MVILLIIGLLLITIAAGIFFYPSRAKNTNHITVSLEELSVIWTKYNEAVETIETSDPTPDELEALFAENKEIGIYEEQPSTANQNKAMLTVQEQLFDEHEKTIVHDKTRTTNNTEIQPVVSVEPIRDTETKDKATDFSSLMEPFKSFWKDCIQPYRKNFDAQGVSDILKKIIELIEKHGHCPSVVMDNRDQEALDLISIRDNLGKITLKEHSYSAARHMLSIIKENYIDFENHIPKAIITTIAHDIGKIPELRLSNAYNTSEHPIVSANKLNEMFIGKNVFWLKQAIKAISEHHIYTEDQFTVFLKQADRMARQQELLSFTKEYQIKKFSDWFNHENLIKAIEPYINVSQEGQKWQAISLNGIVYCRPDFIYEKAKELCKKNKVIDLMFVYESEKGNAIREVVNILREKEIISDLLKPNFASRKFEIHFSMGQKPQKYMLIPVKGNIFNINIGELERRKTNNLILIDRITPV